MYQDSMVGLRAAASGLKIPTIGCLLLSASEGLPLRRFTPTHFHAPPFLYAQELFLTRMSSWNPPPLRPPSEANSEGAELVIRLPPTRPQFFV